VEEQTGKRPNSLISNRVFWVLVCLVIVSLALRIALVRLDRIVRWDEPDYLILGRNLVTGQGYTVSGRPELHYAPLFPIVTGMLYPLTRDMKLNSDICFVVFGTLTLLPFYWLARRLFGTQIGIMATALLCLFPALSAAVLFWGTMLEPLYLFLLYAALCAVWLAWDKGRLLAYLAAGALWGLAYLVKPEAVVYLTLMLVLLIVANQWRRSLFTRRTIVGLVVYLAAFAIVIAPYIAFLYRHSGRILISGKLGVTYVAGQGAVDRDPGLYDRALSQLDEAGEEIIWFSEDRFKYDVWSYIKADPRAFLRRIWQNTNTLEQVLFARHVFPVYLLLFVILGWFGSAWTKERLVKEVFLITAVLPVFIFLPFHIELRYFAPLLPMLLLWVAKGFDALGVWLQQTWKNLRSSPELSSRPRVGLCGALTLAVLAFFLVVQPRVVSDGLAGLNASRRAAGLWLKANSPPGTLIMSRDTEVPYYAERRWAATPNEEYPVFINYVRKRGARYVVVDEREVTVIRPQLALLLAENHPPPELRHVYTAPDPNGKTIVYEVLY